MKEENKEDKEIKEKRFRKDKEHTANQKVFRRIITHSWVEFCLSTSSKNYCIYIFSITYNDKINIVYK